MLKGSLTLREEYGEDKHIYFLKVKTQKRSKIVKYRRGKETGSFPVASSTAVSQFSDGGIVH